MQMQEQDGRTVRCSIELASKWGQIEVGSAMLQSERELAEQVEARSLAAARR